jgi:hypothetical protein
VIGRAMRAWLYRSIKAELIRAALCRMLVGGAVAGIRHLTAFKSILQRVSPTVVFMSVPSSRPVSVELSWEC